MDVDVDVLYSTERPVSSSYDCTGLPPAAVGGQEGGVSQSPPGAEGYRRPCLAPKRGGAERRQDRPPVAAAAVAAAAAAPHPCRGPPPAGPVTVAVPIPVPAPAAPGRHASEHVRHALA